MNLISHFDVHLVLDVFLPTLSSKTSKYLRLIEYIDAESSSTQA